MQLAKAKVLLFGAQIFPACVPAGSPFSGPLQSVEFPCARQSFRLSVDQFQKLLKKKVPIVTPSMLHDSQLHGIVTVEVCIDRKGTVVGIRAVDGHPIAIPSVIESVRRWRFIPYRREGRAISSVGLIEVSYDFRRDK